MLNKLNTPFVLEHEDIPDDEVLLDEMIALVDNARPIGLPWQGSSVFDPLPPEKRRSPGKVLWRIISGSLFYGALILAILAALVYSNGPGEVKNLLGFSYFTVMTPSMQSSIPTGSLIITRKVAADSLEVGDVITFFSTNSDTTITHRIVEIVSGDGLQFRTKGDDNNTEDPDLVPSGRIVGKVVFHVGTLGKLMLALQEHIAWVLALFFLTLLTSFALQQLLRKEERPPKPKRSRRNF